MTGGDSSRSRVVVDVPKKLQGKIIGRRGATLADIESDYPGVDVRVPQRNDPSTEVVITGPSDAVKHAHARVLDICGMTSNNNNARKEANRLYDEAHRLFEDAKNVHGDRARRDALWAKATAKKKEAQAAQMKAGREIFAQKNAGYGDDQMDLHGLYVNEAVDLVQARLKQVDRDLRSGALPDLTIITGAGHHSVGNKAKIKPAVQDLLQKQGYPFTEDPTGGIILVSFGSDSQQPHDQPQTRPQTRPQPQREGETEGGATVFSILSSIAKFFIGLLCKVDGASPTPPHMSRGAGNANENQNVNEASERGAEKEGSDGKEQDGSRSVMKS